MTSMILMGSRPGFVVEGGELPKEHPQHPSQKGSVLLKAIKTAKKPKLKKRVAGSHGGSIVISSSIKTTPGKP